MRKLLLTSLVCATAALAQDGAGGGDASSSTSTGSSTSGGGAATSGYGFNVGANYTLKPSDVIQIEVYNEYDLTKSVRIEADGTVVLPLVGKLKVAGMTVAESQTLITQLYNRDYLVNPQISVLVIEYSRKYVTVIFQSGRGSLVEIPPDRELTLTEAIATVGGIDRLSESKSVKIKRVTEEGGSTVFDVNFKRIISDPDARDFILEDGDIISLKERVI